MASKPFASGHLLAAADVNDLVGVYDRSTGAVDLVSSAAESALYSKAIAAAAMSTDRALRLTVVGDYLNNTGSPQTLTVAVGASGVSYFWKDTTSVTIPTSATRREWRLTCEVANLGSASVQKASGVWLLSNAYAATNGIGDVDGTNGGTATISAPFGGTGTIATASLWTLAMFAQHGASNANLSIRKQYALLELL